MHTLYRTKPVRYYVYTILSLKDLSIYTGFTTDLSKTINEHKKGLIVGTMIRIPFVIIHYEYFINIEDAKRREKYLRTIEGRASLKESLKYTLLSKRYIPFKINK